MKRFLRLERDVELRARVRAASASTYVASQVAIAYGQTLDDLAELCKLRRRIIEDEA